MGFLEGKKALVIGVASKRSIAWGIAQSMHREGADLAFTYQNDRLKDRVVDMAAECNSSAVFPCDVEHDKEIDDLAASLKNHWGSLDILVHAVGSHRAINWKATILTTSHVRDFVLHTISVPTALRHWARHASHYCQKMLHC